ncbi:MAG: DNA topoisomerase IB [Verrucomicrobiota bacterium]
MVNRHKNASPVPIITDPKKSAQVAGLRYVSDEIPGIRRKKSGKNFRYISPQGKAISDLAQIGRIKSLAIPPAWTEVWICPVANGHLQATGRDARGRKQHRYHPRWREVRDETKFNRMIFFARLLPKIRQRVRKDLRLKDLPRPKVLATIVRLLEVSLIRVGNEEYARNNHSFGLTTIQNKHVEVNGARVRFRFRGKSGKNHTIDIRNERLAKIVKHCQDLPGQDLFEYFEENEKRQDVKSEDVNEYLREICGAEFSAKDFRTWSGTVLAAMALREFEKFKTQTQAKKNLVQAIESVAQKLGNTPAICKKCYVHPAIFDSYLDGSLGRILRRGDKNILRASVKNLDSDESAVLTLLQQRLTKDKEPLENSLKRSLATLKKK